MDDAGGVGGGKRLRDLPADVNHRRQRGLSLHLRAQRRTVDELLDDVMAAVVGLADVVDDDDVGVIEAKRRVPRGGTGGRRSRFPLARASA